EHVCEADGVTERAARISRPQRRLRSIEEVPRVVGVAIAARQRVGTEFVRVRTPVAVAVLTRYLADAVVAAISDIESALRVERHPARPGQRRGRRRSRVAAIPADAAARDRRDRPGVYLSYATIVAVGDIDVAPAIDRYAFRRIDGRRGSRGAVATVPADSITRD